MVEVALSVPSAPLAASRRVPMLFEPGILLAKHRRRQEGWVHLEVGQTLLQAKHGGLRGIPKPLGVMPVVSARQVLAVLHGKPVGIGLLERLG